MKKWIFLLLVLSLGSGVGFGYLEPKMFCQINKQQIRISLNPIDGSKCQEYVVYVENTMRTTAKSLVTIQWYIAHRQDVEYWQKIKQQKLTEIDKLQAIRLNIITSMKTFESNLLQKTIEYFMQRVTSYKNKLQKSYTLLANFTGSVTPYISNYKWILSGQLQTIDKISKVTSIESLIPLMDDYVYFKQKITWISE